MAVYLAYPGRKPLLDLEKLNIKVDDRGFTVIDPQGAPMWVATRWKNLNGYGDWAVHLLLSKTVSR